jgi:hypothetical protein
VTENQDPPEPAQPPDPSTPRKWEKPSIQSGTLFETQSLTCLKNENTGTEQCMSSEPKC